MLFLVDINDLYLWILFANVVDQLVYHIAFTNAALTDNDFNKVCTLVRPNGIQVQRPWYIFGHITFKYR